MDVAERKTRQANRRYPSGLFLWKARRGDHFEIDQNVLLPAEGVVRSANDPLSNLIDIILIRKMRHRPSVSEGEQPSECEVEPTDPSDPKTPDPLDLNR